MEWAQKVNVWCCVLPGENCHRGAALGALLAAAAANRGEKIPAKLRDNLSSMKAVAATVVKEMNEI